VSDVPFEFSTYSVLHVFQLFDRPNEVDDVTSLVLYFSDGPRLPVGALSPFGTLVRFPAKSITSFTFKMTGVSPKIQNVGLAEIAVIRANTEMGMINGADNIVGTTQVSASSSETGHTPTAAVDGTVGGYPNQPDAEWSADEKVGATLRLEWPCHRTSIAFDFSTGPISPTR
jgi:hypothetical protein